MPSRRYFLRTMGAGVIAGIRDDNKGGQALQTQNPENNTLNQTTDTSTPTSTIHRGWSAAEPLPAPQSDVGSGVLDGRLYVFGGIESAQGLAAVARTFSFDPVNGTWRCHEDMPRALWGNAGVATTDMLFSFGGAPVDSPYKTGDPPSDEIFIFRPGEGWENLSETTGVSCPYRNFGMRGVYNPTDDLIYCVGGGTNPSPRDTVTNHGAHPQSIGAYDESRIWTFDPRQLQVDDADFARLPEAKRWTSIAVITDDVPAIHAIGGWHGNSGPTDSNIRIDPVTGEVTSMRRTPLPGMYSTTTNSVIGGQVFLSHGLFINDKYTMDSYRVFCHRYDPVLDEFQTDLPKASYVRVGAADGVIDDTLHVVGGHIKKFEGNGSHDAVTHHEVFCPEER